MFGGGASLSSATVLSNSDTMSAPPPYFDPQQNENLYSSIEEQAKEPATYPNEKQLLQAAEAEERERNEQPQASTSTSGTDLSESEDWIASRWRA